MKLLLDSMMPAKIDKFLSGHDVTHVVDLDWQNLSNGKLLTAGESRGFEVLITKDANMPYQQNLAGRTISLVIVSPKSQDFDDLVALAPAILSALSAIKPGRIVKVGGK